MFHTGILFFKLKRNIMYINYFLFPLLLLCCEVRFHNFFYCLGSALFEGNFHTKGHKVASYEWSKVGHRGDHSFARFCFGFPPPSLNQPHSVSFSPLPFWVWIHPFLFGRLSEYWAAATGACSDTNWWHRSSLRLLLTSNRRNTDLSLFFFCFFFFVSIFDRGINISSRWGSFR